MNRINFENRRTLPINSATSTDRGQKRKLNEDVVFDRTGRTEAGDVIGLCLVCDGLGGHGAGEVASRLAAQTVTDQLSHLFVYSAPSLDGADICEMMRAAIHKANEKIRRYAAAHPQEAGNLGTTITLALIYNEACYIANVGDSRAYIWRSGKLRQITRDHSLVTELASLGIIGEADIIDHPQRHLLLQALGSDHHITPDLFTWGLRPGDKLLLCSDGLWQAFPDTTQLAQWLDSTAPLPDLCQQLVAEGIRRDGSDNISVVIVEVNEGPNWRSRIARSVTAAVREVVSLVI